MEREGMRGRERGWEERGGITGWGRGLEGNNIKSQGREEIIENIDRGDGFEQVRGRRIKM